MKIWQKVDLGIAIVWVMTVVTGGAYLLEALCERYPREMDALGLIYFIVWIAIVFVGRFMLSAVIISLTKRRG